MSANLKTDELVDAAVALLKAAALGFVPAIVQPGELAFFVESGGLTEIPAILVTAPRVGLGIGQSGAGLGAGDITLRRVPSETILRVVLVDLWQHGDDVPSVKRARTEAIAQTFIDDVKLGSPAIVGFVLEIAIPTDVELSPPEDALVSFQQDRPLFATAVNVSVVGYSER